MFGMGLTKLSPEPKPQCGTYETLPPAVWGANIPIEAPVYSWDDSVHSSDSDGRGTGNRGLCETVKQRVLASMGLLRGVSV